MPEIALHTELKPDPEHDDEAVHQSIRADVAAAVAENGVRDWRIRRDGTPLFHLIDVENYRAMRHALHGYPADVRRQATVGPLHAQPARKAG